VPQKGVITSNFLSYYLLFKEGLIKINEASPGSADRNRTLGMKKLEAIEVPVPDCKVQVKFDEIYRKLNGVKSQREEQYKLFTALLPSIIDKTFKRELM